MALKSLKSLWDNGILTQDEYNSKVAIINESVKSDKKVLDRFKIEGEDDWKFYLLVIIGIIVLGLLSTFIR